MADELEIEFDLRLMNSSLSSNGIHNRNTLFESDTFYNIFILKPSGGSFVTSPSSSSSSTSGCSQYPSLWLAEDNGLYFSSFHVQAASNNQTCLKRLSALLPTSAYSVYVYANATRILVAINETVVYEATLQSSDISDAYVSAATLLVLWMTDELLVPASNVILSDLFIVANTASPTSPPTRMPTAPTYINLKPVVTKRSTSPANDPEAQHTVFIIEVAVLTVFGCACLGVIAASLCLLKLRHAKKAYERARKRRNNSHHHSRSARARKDKSQSRSRSRAAAAKETTPIATPSTPTQSPSPPPPTAHKCVHQCVMSNSSLTDGFDCRKVTASIIEEVEQRNAKPVKPVKKAKKEKKMIKFTPTAIAVASEHTKESTISELECASHKLRRSKSEFMPYDGAVKAVHHGNHRSTRSQNVSLNANPRRQKQVDSDTEVNVDRELLIRPPPIHVDVSNTNDDDDDDEGDELKMCTTLQPKRGASSSDDRKEPEPNAMDGRVTPVMHTSFDTRHTRNPNTLTLQEAGAFDPPSPASSSDIYSDHGHDTHPETHATHFIAGKASQTTTGSSTNTLTTTMTTTMDTECSQQTPLLGVSPGPSIPSLDTQVTTNGFSEFTNKTQLSSATKRLFLLSEASNDRLTVHVQVHSKQNERIQHNMYKHRALMVDADDSLSRPTTPGLLSGNEDETDDDDDDDMEHLSSGDESTCVTQSVAPIPLTTSLNMDQTQPPPADVFLPERTSGSSENRSYQYLKIKKRTTHKKRDQTNENETQVVSHSTYLQRIKRAFSIQRSSNNTVATSMVASMGILSSLTTLSDRTLEAETQGDDDGDDDDDDEEDTASRTNSSQTLQTLKIRAIAEHESVHHSCRRYGLLMGNRKDSSALESAITASQTTATQTNKNSDTSLCEYEEETCLDEDDDRDEVEELDHDEDEEDEESEDGEYEWIKATLMRCDPAGWSRYYLAFQTHKVDEMRLNKLNDNDWKELIPAIGPRNDFKEMWAVRKMEYETSSE